MERLHCRLFIDNHRFTLQDPGVWVRHAPIPNGLASAAASDGLAVATGTPSGDVRVTVEVCGEDPEPDLASWEWVVELCLHSTTGRLVLMVEGASPDRPARLHGVRPGHYRVRAHARGRDVGFAAPALEEGEEPAEEHLIQLWMVPYPYAEATFKAADAAGNR